MALLLISSIVLDELSNMSPTQKKIERSIPCFVSNKMVNNRPESIFDKLQMKTCHGNLPMIEARYLQKQAPLHTGKLMATCDANDKLNVYQYKSVSEFKDPNNLTPIHT